jgi:hypothetical protein
LRVPSHGWPSMNKRNLVGNTWIEHVTPAV